MSNHIIFENSAVKVTNEFLQIGDEYCQIADIDYPMHKVDREWGAAFVNAGILIAAIYILINFVTSTWAYVVIFLFMAAWSKIVSQPKMTASNEARSRSRSVSENWAWSGRNRSRRMNINEIVLFV